MISPEDKMNFFKSLRIITACSGYPAFKAFIELNMHERMRIIHDTIDERCLRVAIGEHKILSELLQELEDSPKNELAYANGESSSGISIPL